jgi:hypothetical protein
MIVPYKMPNVAKLKKSILSTLVFPQSAMRAATSECSLRSCKESSEKVFSATWTRETAKPRCCVDIATSKNQTSHEERQIARWEHALQYFFHNYYEGNECNELDAQQHKKPPFASTVRSPLIVVMMRITLHCVMQHS